MNPTSNYETLAHGAGAEPVRWDGDMSDGVGYTYGDPPSFLSATADELLLCGNRGSFRLPRSAIRKIGRGRFYPWLFRAVRLHHDIRSYPDELQFKPRGAQPGEVLQRLKALGYPVS